MYTEVSNVWESKAKTPEEAKSLQLRAQMMIVLRQIICDRGWSQKEAAISLGISQPRVSYIINGQVSKFAVDKLLGLLMKAGYNFDISLKDGVPQFETTVAA